MSEDATSRMLPAGVSPKLAAYVCCAYLSQSEENRHLQPAFSKPSLMPPIPQKRSTNVYSDIALRPRVLRKAYRLLFGGANILSFTYTIVLRIWEPVQFLGIHEDNSGPQAWRQSV